MCAAACSRPHHPKQQTAQLLNRSISHGGCGADCSGCMQALQSSQLPNILAICIYNQIIIRTSSSMPTGKAAPARLAHKTPAVTAAAKAHPPPPTATSITLTTQCSLDRWSRFVQQAESWGGPVSVAVYVPAPEGTPAAQHCLHILAQHADQHAAQYPHQQLQVAPLFAGHYAREGASVLTAAGE